MEKSHPSERKFQNFVKKAWFGFSTQLHPGIGSDRGVPDLLLLSDMGLIPVELKIGKIEGGKLWSSEVRPSQLGWHSRLAAAGGISVFFIGVFEDNTWRIFAVDSLKMTQWETAGFQVGKTAIELNPEHLNSEFQNFLERRHSLKQMLIQILFYHIQNVHQNYVRYRQT